MGSISTKAAADESAIRQACNTANAYIVGTSERSKHEYPDYYHHRFEFNDANSKGWTKVWPLLVPDMSPAKNSKTLYLFDDKTERNNQNFDKSKMRIEITDCYDIFEYFPHGFDANKRIIPMFVLCGKYKFRCYTTTARDVFIQATIETLHYTKDCGDNKIHKWRTVKYKYKPIYSCLQNSYFTYNDDIKWLDIPIFIGIDNPMFCLEGNNGNGLKFLLSINVESFTLNINAQLCKGIIFEMMKSYFGISEKSGDIEFTLQVNKVVNSLVNKNSNGDDRSRRYCGKWNASFTTGDLAMICTHGLRVNFKSIAQKVQTPSLKGVGCCNCDKDLETKENKENKENKEDDSDNGKLKLPMNECVDGFNCKIYKAMKEKYQYTKSNYQHVFNYNHFNFNYENKPKCRHKSQCKAFKRVARINENVDDFNCHKFSDLCHLLIYKHPPRIDRSGNVNILFAQSKAKGQDGKHEWGNSRFESADLLIAEIIKNDCEKDLCTTGKDLKSKYYTLLKIVNEKSESFIHKVKYMNVLHNYRGCMLSLLLYTGCDSNYQLCKAQRNGDYSTWKEFDTNLLKSIRILSKMEDYSFYFDNIKGFYVYSGLNKTQLTDDTSLEYCCFPTYISTSYNRQISKSFAKENGMLMQFDHSFIKQNSYDYKKKPVLFCSVEWISKFAGECEILFARSTITKKIDDYNCSGVTAATMKVVDYEFINNDYHGANNANGANDPKTLQIVQVSQFKPHPMVDLLQRQKIDKLEELFNAAVIPCDTLLSIIKEIDCLKKGLQGNIKGDADSNDDDAGQEAASLINSFGNSLKSLYNDQLFQLYKQKCEIINCNNIFNNNTNTFELVQTDIMKMQKQSILLNELLKDFDMIDIWISCCKTVKINQGKIEIDFKQLWQIIIQNSNKIVQLGSVVDFVQLD